MGADERKRASLIDNLDEPIDLLDIINKTPEKKPFTKKDKKSIAIASYAAGFPSREVKKSSRKRKKSPFTEPAGFRIRPEVKTIFQALSDELDCRDYTTFENAFKCYLKELRRVDLLELINS